MRVSYDNRTRRSSPMNYEPVVLQLLQRAATDGAALAAALDNAANFASNIQRKRQADATLEMIGRHLRACLPSLIVAKCFTTAPAAVHRLMEVHCRHADAPGARTYAVALLPHLKATTPALVTAAEASRHAPFPGKLAAALENVVKVSDKALAASRNRAA